MPRLDLASALAPKLVLDVFANGEAISVPVDHPTHKVGDIGPSIGYKNMGSFPAI